MSKMDDLLVELKKYRSYIICTYNCLPYSKEQSEKANKSLNRFDDIVDELQGYSDARKRKINVPQSWLKEFEMIVEEELNKIES